MKTVPAVLVLLSTLAASWAASTVNSSNKFAYGANIGWVDWRGDTNNGAVIGEYVCSGSIYAANVGWIRLGNGTPADGIHYQNDSATDYGVNHDGLGNLRGFAYGANIGWVNFESNGGAKVDLKTGKLSGFAYSANCGWISLSNTLAHVQTDTIANGADTDGDGITDAWELTHTNSLSAFSASSDSDGDGVSDRNEYIADTNPTDPADLLRIIGYDTTPGGTMTMLTWQSTLTRCYFVEKNPDLSASVWLDSGLGAIMADGAATTRAFADTSAPARFFRVRAAKPLAP